jgi:hypothetical protein
MDQRVVIDYRSLEAFVNPGTAAGVVTALAMQHEGNLEMLQESFRRGGVTAEERQQLRAFLLQQKWFNGNPKHRRVCLFWGLPWQEPPNSGILLLPLSLSARICCLLRQMRVSGPGSGAFSGAYRSLSPPWRPRTDRTRSSNMSRTAPSCLCLASSDTSPLKARAKQLLDA